MINLFNIVLILFTFCFSLPSFARETPPIQLATKYKLLQNIEDYWISEKLDGVRGYWNGKALLTKNGNKLNAPKWFTKQWPNTPLDGELWIERHAFENVLSCVSQKTPKPCWQKVRFMIFDLPNNKHVFTERITLINTLVAQTPSKFIKSIKQFKLLNETQLQQTLNKVVKNKGEGLILHYQNALYTSGKSRNIMKLKPYQEGEATVIHHIKGNGKYEKLLGSIKVKTSDNISFKIGSGFTDNDRHLPPPIGATIVFKYIGKTQKGVPKFASFLRVKSLENKK